MKLLIIVLALCSSIGLYGQNYNALEKALKTKFSENSVKDGRWVYYPDKASIKKINKPLIQAVFPNYSFYEVTLTNFLGYHVNQGTCVVLFDSLKSEIVLAPPLWYSGVNAHLIKRFLKKQFNSKEELLAILKELHELMGNGSGYKFVNTSYTETLITYDMVYFAGDSYTVNGPGTSSTVNYNSDGIWRQIEVKIKDLKMIEYTSINARLKANEEYKKEYKVTIK